MTINCIDIFYAHTFCHVIAIIAPYFHRMKKIFLIQRFIKALSCYVALAIVIAWVGEGAGGVRAAELNGTVFNYLNAL